MNWFVLRQHRKQFLIFALLLAAIAALIIPTGIHYWHSYQTALSTCHATNTCDDLDSAVFGGGDAQLVKNLLFAIGLFAPLILGLFMGSPLLAREYEEGTNKLAWTQSVSRRKWLTTKLVWALVFALIFGTILTALATWWSRTTDAIDHNRFNTGFFDVVGLLPVAYSLFFTTIGFMVGAWFRKTLVAMGVTLGVFVLCLVGFGTWIRPHYMTPVTITGPMGPDFMAATPKGAWILTRNILNKDGHVVSDIFPAAPPKCRQLIQQANSANGNGSGTAIRVKATPGGGDPIDACLNNAGWHQVISFQPSYRYWDFQRIEASIYLGMTALAVAATYLLVLKRDA